MKKDLRESNRRGGFYWLGKKPYVSVTNVLKIIDKPALKYWFGKEVYWGVIKDTTLSERDALAVPYATSEVAKDRGSTVHSIVEVYTTNKKKIENIPDPFKGYAQAFYSWVDDNQVEILKQEQTIINEEHLYAGTLDMIANVNGVHYIIDVKTGKGIYPEAGLQLSAYKHAVDNGEKYKIGVILLGETGKYKFEEMEYNFDVFLHTKAVWEWNNKELLEKVGYGKV